MSRIGKQPIAIPAKVKVEVKGQKVSVEGPKGKLNWELPNRTSLKVEGDKIIVSRSGDDSTSKAHRRPPQRLRVCHEYSPCLYPFPRRSLKALIEHEQLPRVITHP